VGFATADDAAVYRLSAREAVVSTVDFFPPVVDDPFAYGQIAAANALSDVWAMGARPLFALNLVAFPTQALPLEILARILEGGQSKADEAGIPILGGHSVDDPEPKYGMAVTGLVHPRRILTNAGGRPGDVLLLTKPIGSGIATTAIKRGIATPELEASVVELMSQNFETEARIDDEADKMAEEQARLNPGVDATRLRSMIRQRLAQKRNFTL